MAEDRPRNTVLEDISARPVFHLAFPVNDLEAARAFYGEVLNCPIGREAPTWIDFNFFGYQITVHLDRGHTGPQISNEVDGAAIPVPHFGLILAWDDWHQAVDHLNYIGVRYVLPPAIRFAGQVGEQATFFLADPSGNVLEFKAFRSADDIFRNETGS